MHCSPIYLQVACGEILCVCIIKGRKKKKKRQKDKAKKAKWQHLAILGKGQSNPSMSSQVLFNRTVLHSPPEQSRYVRRSPLQRKAGKKRKERNLQIQANPQKQDHTK